MNKFNLKAIIFALIPLLLLAGCQSYSEIENALMVSGIAVDKGEDGGYRATIEIVSMQGGENAPPSSQTVFSEGETVFGALQNINALAPKELYFSQATLIAISEEVAKDGLINIVDLIIRDDQLRITNDVVIAKGCMASDLFTAKGTDEQIISYEISSILQNESSVVSEVPRVQVFELINIIGSSGVSAVLPAFTLEAGELNLFGTAFFNEDKLAGFLDAHESKLMTLVQGQTKSGYITLKIKTDRGEYLTAEIFDARTRVKAREDKNNIIMDITIDASVGIGQLITKENLMTPQGRDKLMKALEKDIEKNITSLILKMQNEYSSDVFGFGERIYKQKPDLWEKLSEKNYFKNLGFTVQVQTNLRSTGFIAKSPSSRDFRIKDVID